MAVALLAIPIEAAAEDRRIALAFDDGPSSSNNEALLNELERQDIKATLSELLTQKKNSTMT